MPVPELSFCMIAKNEEPRLARCLDSVRDLAAELIVVDTGSTDGTGSIAQGYGATVVCCDFSRVDFAAARNCALGHARGRWILVLDADEALEPGAAEEIGRYIAGDANAGYYFERHNCSAETGTSTKDYVVRLFPNRAEYRYRGRVHETIDAAIRAGGGRLIKTAIGIDHKFALNREERRRKNRWYIEILQEEIAADPTDDTRLDFLAAEYHQLERFDEAAEVAERIARLRPHDARAHLFAGTYHLLYQSDLPRARADFHQALKLRPDYPEARSFLELLEQREREGRARGGK